MSIMSQCRACSEASEMFQRGILELLILHIPSALGCVNVKQSKIKIPKIFINL